MNRRARFLPGVLVALVLGAGCVPVLPSASPVATVGLAVPAPATRSAASAAAPATATDVVDEAALVTAVTDGDTITVEIRGRTFKLRYIGMDTPETAFEQEAFGAEATEVNRRLVLGKTVRLERDVSETDRYGRLLRYVWLGDLMVNAELVRLGYARANRYPPDVKYAELLEAAEAEAKAARRGLWGLPSTPSVAPGPTRAPVATLPGVGYTCDRCIKGNIGSTGEKIYHFPGCADYDDTVVNEAKGERWFSTEAEAQRAGWRRARNCP